MDICYYIYAPRYVTTSAGIRALYLLASLLRQVGQHAWIVTYIGHVQDQLPKEYEDLILLYDQAVAHKKAGVRPIVLYAETVDGNPLKAKAIVRYIMNSPGLLGGPKIYSKNEYLYAFSETLAAKISKPDYSLFLPLVDETYFVPGNEEKTLTCVYASKYRMVHKAEVGELPEGTIEITRDEQISPDRSALLKILQKTKRLYLYENSAIAIEAALCGCLVIFIPNPFLDLSIGAKEHGESGMAWGQSPQELARAEATLSQFRHDYISYRTTLPNRLRLFVERTIAFRSGMAGYGLSLSALRPPEYAQRASQSINHFIDANGFQGLFAKGIKVLIKRGPLTTIRILVSFIKTRFMR